MQYNTGDWIRVYTTSLRGPGASTVIGEIVEFGECNGDSAPTKTVRIENAVGVYVVPVGNIVGRVAHPR